MRRSRKYGAKFARAWGADRSIRIGVGFVAVPGIGLTSDLGAGVQAGPQLGRRARPSTLNCLACL